MKTESSLTKPTQNGYFSYGRSADPTDKGMVVTGHGTPRHQVLQPVQYKSFEVADGHVSADNFWEWI